jgi:hypothetical protein
MTRSQVAFIRGVLGRVVMIAPMLARVRDNCVIST